MPLKLLSYRLRNHKLVSLPYNEYGHNKSWRLSIILDRVPSVIYSSFFLLKNKLYGYWLGNTVLPILKGFLIQMSKTKRHVFLK